MADQIEKNDIENTKNANSTNDSSQSASSRLIDELYRELDQRQPRSVENKKENQSPENQDMKRSAFDVMNEVKNTKRLESSALIVTGDGMRKLATGDTLITEGDRQSLYTEKGDRVLLEPDGTYSIKGNVKAIDKDKDGRTTVTFNDGAKVSFTKDGISSVSRDGHTAHIISLEKSSLPKFKLDEKNGRIGGGGGGGTGGSYSESWGEYGGGSAGGGGKGSYSEGSKKSGGTKGDAHTAPSAPKVE